MESITRRAALAPLFLFLLYMLIGGCAADGIGSASRQAAPASRYNLAGYSAGFKEGFADACASPRRRSESRYKSDADYQMGWNDGSNLCRK